MGTYRNGRGQQRWKCHSCGEGGTAIDRFRFGRTDAQRWIGSADVGVNPADRLSFQVTYSFEQRNERLSAAAKDDAPKGADDFGIPDNFAQENYWKSKMGERVHSIGLNTTVQVVPDRVVVDAGYNLSLSDLDIGTSNPSGVQATTLANAVANDWPSIKNRVHEVFGDLGYTISPNVRAGVRYLWESYDLDDFAWDIMDPYMAGRTAENSTRYLFADAVYNAYEAHVGTVYIAGSF